MMHSAHNDVPSKRLSIKKFRTESYLVELNLSKKRSLLSCFYNPNDGKTLFC